MAAISYRSTNRTLALEQLLGIKDISPEITGAFTNKVSFKDAIILGQAPDTGLFVPTRFPRLSFGEIRRLQGKPFSETAYLIFRKFLTQEEIPDASLHELVTEAYDFPYPLEHLEGRQYLLMHTESPTGDFKNTGARANARFLSYMKSPEERFIRLTTTSGDTGGAVGLADHLVPGLFSIIAYPQGHISPVQEDIIRKIGGNVYAVAVEGATFSPIQDEMAKRAFADTELRQELKELGFGFTSGNSINWGRIMPQIAHFVYAYAQLADPVGEEAVFSTPLGNMGHGLAGDMARLMGLPIFSVWPTNENDPFPRYLESSVYRPLRDDEENRRCRSNSMIVKNPSNLARLFDFYGGQVTKDGKVNESPDIGGIRSNIASMKVTMAQEDTTIRDVYSRYGIIIEPHGACAVHGLWQHVAARAIPKERLCIAQITANPFKYHDHIKALTGVEPGKPKAYEWFDKRPLGGRTMPFGYENLTSLIREIAREHA
jgi:threonine synthase